MASMIFEGKKKKSEKRRKKGYCYLTTTPTLPHKIPKKKRGYHDTSSNKMKDGVWPLGGSARGARKVLTHPTRLCMQQTRQSFFF